MWTLSHTQDLRCSKESGDVLALGLGVADKPRHALLLLLLLPPKYMHTYLHTHPLLLHIPSACT